MRLAVRAVRALAHAMLCSAVLGGCATIRNEPINVPLAAPDLAVISDD
jgi:hypothetical protein